MTKLVVEGHLVDDDRGRQDTITEDHRQRVEQAIRYFRYEFKGRFGSNDVWSYCSRTGIPQYGRQVCSILGV